MKGRTRYPLRSPSGGYGSRHNAGKNYDCGTHLPQAGCQGRIKAGQPYVRIYLFPRRTELLRPVEQAICPACATFYGYSEPVTV